MPQALKCPSVDVVWAFVRYFIRLVSRKAVDTVADTKRILKSHVALLLPYRSIRRRVFRTRRNALRTRGHKYKLFKKRSTSRMCGIHLPSDVVKFNTLSAFERTIKLVDFTDYLKCF